MADVTIINALRQCTQFKLQSSVSKLVTALQECYDSSSRVEQREDARNLSRGCCGLTLPRSSYTWMVS